jgi:uncharacterized membrane protein
MLDHQFLSVVIRWLHIGAMAFALGGALLLWVLNTRIRFIETLDAPTRLTISEMYEFFFWGAIGILIMTGVGNLGAFGQGLPNPNSVWSSKFVIKLTLVLLLILFSLMRTLFIARLRAAHASLASPRVLPFLYAITTFGLLTILFVAVSLAHG